MATGETPGRSLWRPPQCGSALHTTRPSGSATGREDSSDAAL